MTDKRWKHRPDGSTWGDFGPDDQIGRMNLLTEAHRIAALAEVREGRAFTLSLPLDYPGGNVLFEHRREPKLFYEKRGEGHNFNYDWRSVCSCYNDVICDDGVVLYTQYSTHWDALGHVGQRFDADGDGVEEKVFYNGYRAGEHLIGPDDSDAPGGALKLGIENLATAGVQGRGVLVDLEARHGRKRAIVGYDGLMAALEAQGAEVGEGDFLCLYTGFADLLLEMRKAPDAQVLRTSCAALDGRDARLLQWITDSGIVAICADNFAVEHYPAEPAEAESYPILPLHNHCLFRLGVHLGELWHFAELARYCRSAGRWRFLLTAPPLRLPHSVGGPTTPIATV